MSNNSNELTHPYQSGHWVNIALESNKYRFLRDTRFGSGGYKSGKYLVPHKRESTSDYNLRASKCYLSNQYKPILSAHYKPIFKNPALRITVDNVPQGPEALYNAFLINADGKGSSLQSVMEQASAKTKNLGASFLVLNNSVDIDSTIEDVIKERKGVPYVFTITPDMVHQYTQDSFGNLTSLEWYQQDGAKTFDQNGNLTTLSGLPDAPNGTNTSNEYMIVGVDAESWYIRDENGDKSEKVENTIKVLPVVRLVDEETDEIIPESSLYSVARIQHRIFNLSSIITDVADNQGFSIFTMPVGPKGGVEFSTTKGIQYPQDSSNKPEFISPDATQLKTLIELLNNLINEIYQAGVVNHLQRFQQSAESKELDRERLNDLLGTFKRQIESAERGLMYLFGLYVGFDYGYNVVYSDDFGVSTLTERIDRYVQLASVESTSDVLLNGLELNIAPDVLDLEDGELKEEFLDKLETSQELRRNQATIENTF